MEKLIDRLEKLLKREIAAQESLTDLNLAFLVRMGQAAEKLTLSGVKTGLGGKPRVEFEKTKANAQLVLRIGDPVVVFATSTADFSSPSTLKFEATLVSVDKNCITVSIRDSDKADQLTEFPSFAIAKHESNLPLLRMMDAAAALRKLTANTSSLSMLFSTLLYSPLRPPNFCSKVMGDNEFLNQSLNESQKQAIRKCISSDTLSLIHGPPGTGKTETVVELVRQLVARGERVLVCGPSNICVDTLAARLDSYVRPGFEVTRIGNPARVRREQVLTHVLDIRVRSSDEGRIVNDVRREMDETLIKIGKCKRKSEKRALYLELKQLRTELRRRENKVVSDIMNKSNVVISTLSGCGSHVMRDQSFDSVVIDESSQAIEAESWIAILKSKKRLFLAGDHLQLPPTVKSSSAISNQTTLKFYHDDGFVIPESLEYTLFDRMLETYGENIKTMLDTQYRMHETIMQFPSKFLYDGKLKAHDSVKAHLLCEMEGVSDTGETSSPFMLLNTCQAGFGEHFPALGNGSVSNVSESLQNQGEVNIIQDHVVKLLEAGVEPVNIVVITPYSAQVHLLKMQLNPICPAIEVGTVDSFQGAEKEAVIISLVRSNDEGNLGFLNDIRRLNVAFTRARRHLCVVGDFGSTMTRGNKFLSGVEKFVEESGDIIYV